MQTFRVEVGEAHGAKPGNLMGAIANEAGLEARQIGRIRVLEQHSLVELPEGLPARILKHLVKVRVAGQMLKIHPTEPMPPRGPRKEAQGQTGPVPSDRRVERSVDRKTDRKPERYSDRKPARPRTS